MKICALTTSYPTTNDTTRGIFIYRLFQTLQQQGHQVTFVCPHGFSSLIGGAGIFSNLQYNWIARFLFIPYVLVFFFHILRKTPHCDIIHANWSLTAFLALLAKPIHHKKIILTERSSHLIQLHNPFLKFFIRFTYTHVDCLVVLSKTAQHQLSSNYNIPFSSFLVVPNGVDIPRLSSKNSLRRTLHLPQKTIILAVGRLTRDKSLDTLLQAFHHLHVSSNSYHLVLVGDGEDKQRLQDLADTLGLRSFVTFTGKVSHEQVYSYMAASDIFVQTSLKDSGGNVILESMAHGLAIVSTPVGWAKDYLVADKNGLFFTPRDAVDLSKYILLLLKKPKLLHTLGRAARQTILHEHLTWKNCAQHYLQLYREALS
ncbi:MAG: glycosyltransferase family 4 protein [Candidatus Woesearchaeota archaeon]|nr:glycosyltransferase family 4 protein [Candidatus Woesearchaeota archaeon]